MDAHTIDLYYFTGTGNTLRVVNAMAEAFREAGRTANVRRMEEGAPAAIAPGHALGLAFPIAIFTTYPSVWDFVRALPPGHGVPAFMVDTLGGLAFAVVGPLREMLRHKGYRPVGAREIPMPLNVFFTMPEAMAQARLAHGPATARAFAHDLLADRAHWGHVPLLPDLALAVLGSRWLWRLVARTAHAVIVDETRCTGCSLCVALCPTGNLVMGDEGSGFGVQGSAGAANPTSSLSLGERAGVREALPHGLGRCQECLRCFAICPTDALRRPWYAPRYGAATAKEMLGQ